MSPESPVENKVFWLTPGLAVAPQLTEAEIAALAGHGFRAVINNRPDGESADQPPTARMQAAAEAAGLAYRYLPVVSGRLTEADVQAFGEAVESLDGPVLAFCRSGTRCTMLWALHASSRQDPDAIVQAAAAAGYDLRGLRPALQARWQAAQA